MAASVGDPISRHLACLIWRCFAIGFGGPRAPAQFAGAYRQVVYWHVLAPAGEDLQEL